ncbi:MAG: type IX secretion system outer membrane channel protein PorV [Bacteroidales bacterium]|nr:type IX secretion system outer membrane channel protein PorV [Bacteroidales bacterium]
MKRLSLLLMFATLSMAIQAQQTGQNKNYISTGMPILLIAPDAVSSGMGDVGVASTPDIYSAHWNNAKFAFIDGNMGISTTYTPWLRNLHVSDMNLLYLGGYYRINENSVAAAGLTYFSLGEIENTDNLGNLQGKLHPNEFAVDASYALKLNENLSLGATVRYIYSNLTDNAIVSSEDASNMATHAARSAAADIGLYYTTEIDAQSEMALGLFISNLGAKLSYANEDNDKEFLPANIRIGGRYTSKIDDYNKISLLVDVNKLLVPTRPIDSTGTRYVRNLTEYNNLGVIQGALQSFMDAPGGFREEMQELQLSAGAEYWYAETFAARVGYFYEHENKGGRKYATVGFGLRYTIFSFDFSYLIPTTKISTSPLAHTIRMTIGVDLKPTK